MNLKWEPDQVCHHIPIMTFTSSNSTSYVLWNTLTHFMDSSTHCTAVSAPDWCAAPLTGSPEGNLWCSGLCWSKGGTGSWAAAFCWVCVSQGTGRGQRNGPPESSGRPQYCWGTRRARSSCRNCCSRPVREKRSILLWLFNERPFQAACQSITLIDSPVCVSDSSRHYFNSADVLPLLHLHCGPIVSISSSEQNAFVMHSSNLFYRHGTISIIVCLWRRRVLWHQKCKHEEQPADTGCLLWSRKRIVIRCTLQWVMFCMRHQTTACLWHVCSKLQYAIWIVSFIFG